MTKAVEEYNLEFFARNGFDESGKGYVVLGNTYEIREQLKELGGRFNSFLRAWILPHDYGFDCIEVNASQIFYVNQQGKYMWNMPSIDVNNLFVEIRDRNNEINRNNSKSRFQGEVGKKIEVDVDNAECVSSCSSRFGTSYVYRFTDHQGNIYTWITTKYFSNISDVSRISGVVKDHDTFRGEEQTILSRCTIEDQDHNPM